MTILSDLASILKTTLASTQRIARSFGDGLATTFTAARNHLRARLAGEEGGRAQAFQDTIQEARVGIIPENECVYAIGDIHGRLDLLQALIEKIRIDSNSLPPGTRIKLVFLGDYIDRGLKSKQVVDFLLSNELDAFETVYLMGNHEEALLRFIEDVRFGETWTSYGGVETLYSYGFQVPNHMPLGNPGSEISYEDSWLTLWDRFRTSMPEEHLAFYRQLTPYYIVGDYVFVHAGLKPGVPIEQQSANDLFWIRDEFLKDQRKFDKIVVHGHTPTDRVVHDHRRIGLDTGAFITGCLTAGRFFQNEVQFIST